MYRAGNVLRSALFLTIVALWAHYAQAISYITLDHPLGAHGTMARGVDGTNIVGTYTEASNQTHGFFYDGVSFTTIDSGFSMRIHGIFLPLMRSKWSA